MKLSSPTPYIMRLLVAVAAVVFALNSAHAAAVTILPNAVSFEYFGLNFANNIQTSNTLGTLNYSGQPGCGGTCSATTALGASPSVSATVNEVVFQATGGGGVQVDLAYYVEYLNAAGTYTVNLHAIDSLSAPDGAPVSAHLAFGPAGPSTTSFNNFSSVAFQETDCVNGCPPPGSANPAPFVADHQIQMVANTPYLVQLDLAFRPTTSGVQISGLIDPMFTTDILGGRFIYSPGVFDASPAVPEPSTWMMMILGFAGISLMAYRRQSEPALMAI